MYTQRIERTNPGCLVVLVDQSASMYEPIAGTGLPKSVVVAEQLNITIMELIRRCTSTDTEAVDPSLAVSVIGYRTDADGVAVVESCLDVPGRSGDLAWTTDLAQHPRRLEDRTGDTGGRSITYRQPIWVEPRNEGGTPMCAAMDRAGRIAHSWVQSSPQSFPPVVINLTDGESTDGDARLWAERLRGVRTHDGALLLFNIMLASGERVAPTMFPSDPSDLNDHRAEQLFEMSSELPDSMRAAAEGLGHRVGPGARGMATNADLRAVVSFLHVGLAVDQPH